MDGHNNDQSEGTIEWWVRTPISYYSHRLILYDGATHAINLYFQNDGNIYARGGSQIYLTTYSANTWTHVRIDFDCGSDTFSVYINGEKFGPFAFKNGVSVIDKVFFDTGGASNTRYLDAVSYSWDDYYDPGDNRHEGLLLDFTPDDLTNMEYTLNDGQTQTTVPIYGDTAIPIPETGDYTLTVSGDGYASSSVSFNTKISTGFLYAQSSEPHEWSDTGTWTDVDCTIDSVETPGEYYVIYTATYEVSNPGYYIPPRGSGWVQLMVDGGGIIETRRRWDCLNTIRPIDKIYGTLIVADKVTLGSGGVKAEIHFDASDPWDTMTLLERSICAIPLKEGYVYDYSTTTKSWDQEGTYTDPDIYLESLTGDYFAIYTATFELSGLPHYIGVHSDGWTRFGNCKNDDLDYTIRYWEMPASFAETMMSGTLLLTDQIHLDNNDLNITLRLNQRKNFIPECNPMLTIGKRSLILIPLTNDYVYERRTVQTEDLNQDIAFEDINSKCFVMYTATNLIEEDDPGPLDEPEGWGWVAINDGITTLDHTTRRFEFAHGYGNSMRKTRYVVEILDLFKNDIKVEYYWDPFDDETFYLRQRSMILIPFF